MSARLRRRTLLASGAGLALSAPVAVWAQRPSPASGPDAETERALRVGLAAGGVLMFRHALAPGTFDPPGFKLGDCATQRNLNDVGRGEAQRIGAWFAARQLKPIRVRSSPWCRCVDTARLAFGDRVEEWPALGSPRGMSEATNQASLSQMSAALAGVMRQRAGFEVWVTHNFVFGAWLGESVSTGDAVLVGAGNDGARRVVLKVTGLAG